MVMDQVFGQVGGDYLQMDSDLPFIDDTKIMNEISMDLDDFNFDFDSMSDSLGSWIQPDDLKIDISDLSDDIDLCSESIVPEDLNITEAVRYDCMWSSNPSSPTIQNEKPQPLCENSLFEEFLKIVDIPSHFDLGIDIKSEPLDQTKEIKTEPKKECDDLSNKENDVRMFTSLDHCYVSSTIPASHKHTYSSNFPVTPPESSEDEDSTASSPFPHIINPAPSTCNRSQSLLKSSRPKSGGGEPKFCFRVKLKSDKSRSLLKQRTNLVNNSPVKKSLGIMNRNMVQTSIRRRKEENLHVKHHEAREIHNHMERQRRNELKVSYDNLKACIPDIANSEKVSKQMILDTALEKCKLVKSKEISLKMRKDKLKRNNAELRQRLKNLKQMQKV